MLRITTSSIHWMYKACVCMCMHPRPPDTHAHEPVKRAQDTRKFNLGHLLGGTNLASGLWLQMPGINRAGPSDWQTLGCQHPLHSQEFKLCFCHDLVVWLWVSHSRLTFSAKGSNGCLFFVWHGCCGLHWATARDNVILRVRPRLFCKPKLSDTPPKRPCSCLSIHMMGLLKNIPAHVWQ